MGPDPTYIPERACQPIRSSMSTEMGAIDTALTLEDALALLSAREGWTSILHGPPMVMSTVIDVQ